MVEPHSGGSARMIKMDKRYANQYQEPKVIALAAVKSNVSEAWLWQSGLLLALYGCITFLAH
jgi:hypothetical protein